MKRAVRLLLHYQGLWMKSSDCKLIHIEDNVDDSEVFQIILKQSGINIPIKSFSDGKSAFDFLKDLISSEEASNFLVILDLNLPLMTGSEILKELNESDKTNQIPIIVFSGSENPEDKKLCLSLGARMFFIKPWNLNGYREFINGPFMNELQKICPEFEPHHAP